MNFFSTSQNFFVSALFVCLFVCLFVKKKKYTKILKGTLSRLLTSKFDKSFIQPFIMSYTDPRTCLGLARGPNTAMRNFPQGLK